MADPYGPASLIARIIAEHGRAHWRSYALAYVLMAVTAGCTALATYLFGHVVNEALLSRNFVAIGALCAITIATYAVKGLATYGYAVVLQYIANDISTENTQRMFAKLVRESLGYFADRPSSGMMAQVTYGAAAVPAALNLLVTAAGRDALTLISLAAVMVIQDPLMSIIGLVVMPPALLLLRSLRARVRTLALTRFGGGAALMETIQEALQGLRIVKTFGLEDVMRRRVAESAELVRDAGNELARLSNRSGPIMEALGGVVIALIFLYGGFRVLHLNATPGEFVSFIAAFLLAYEPAKRLAHVHLDIVNHLVGVRIMYHLLDPAPTEPDDERRPRLRIAGGRVELINVDFAYRSDEPVIRGMSFVAEAGCVTALVGHSGSGKSTALSLILRLYDPSAGAIRIDAQDIATVSRRSVRDQIAYVGQDVFLFRGSIQQNIAIGAPDAQQSAIVAAAKAAYAHDFIMAFPQGYDTPVGEHGLQLSAGQRQRIAVARALLKDARIILLDEPTAALDMESEREVYHALAELCAGRTTLVIAHRLHTITAADCIHVVENGTVVESGRHQDLLRKGKRYAAFYNLLLQEETPEQCAV